jgi:hypothetical protein
LQSVLLRHCTHNPVVVSQTAVGPLHPVVPCHWPLLLQDCGVLPLHRVCPVAHAPWHMPLTHVWLLHAVAFCQAPEELQLWGCVLDTHCPVPGVQATQLPLKHAGVLPEHVDEDAS